MKRKPDAEDAPRLAVVGIGDDGPIGIGEHARNLIREAELLAGGRRHLAFFAEHPAEKLAITNNVDQVVERLAAEPDHRRCVVLASGDPCFFGIGPRLVERLGRERVEIIPHVSSVALAFARFGLSWQDAVVVSAHGRPLQDVLGPAAQGGKLAILTDDENTPAVIAEALLASGMPDCPAFVCEHLGGPAERVVETRLAELPGREFARLNVLILIGPRDRGLSLGLPESNYHHARGQITKAEVRAVALAKLRLPEDGVLWDVGAGSGSLSIEAAGLMPRGTIYAVERDPEQLACLRENVRRHLTPQVRVVDGQAPEILRELPWPDRVFVGGGGSALVSILAVCLERLNATEQRPRPAPCHPEPFASLKGKPREGSGIQPVRTSRSPILRCAQDDSSVGAAIVRRSHSVLQGRLVVNAATLESVVDAQALLRKANWAYELVQLAVSRGREVGGRTRLDPLGPVFILSAWPGLGDAER